METFWICLSVVSVLLVIFGFILALRYLSYRETLALAEKGLVRPERQRRDNKDSLRWGVILSGLGLALFLGLWPIGGSSGSQYPFGLGPWMLFGLIPLFFGLSLILIHILTHDRNKHEEE